ncbi:MAG: TlpA disulfide reductase family protein [Desulfuromonadales bacterium]|nr:TlpA disulfide reductase family protein [Desulfuromonadales bacterium]
MRIYSPLLLLALCSLLLTACSKENSAPASKGVAADFTLRDLDGKEHKLSDYRGKVVFLNFWATWCPPCRAEIPSMGRLNEVMGSNDFVMLAVNTDENIKDLQAFVKEVPHNFTVLSDADGKIQKLYKVFKFPETFVIDRQGNIVEHIIGARDWSSTEALKFFNAQIAGGK